MLSISGDNHWKYGSFLGSQLFTPVPYLSVTWPLDC
jgi:hypothetical protein